MVMMIRMKRVFGVKNDKEPTPSIQDTTDRVNKRDDKIKKLDSELARYKEQIKKTRPGPAHEAVKARAMRVLKQKKMYEGHMLYDQTFNLDQVAFAAEGIKDAQQTALLEYEKYKMRNGELPFTDATLPDPVSGNQVDLNHDSGSGGGGRARRDAAARAMQGM